MNAGYGVFTDEFIPSNKLIDEYVGTKYTRNYGGGYTVEVNESCYIDASEFPRCYMAMINDGNFKHKMKGKKNKNIIHPLSPEINCEFKINDERVFVYSIKDIPPNQELFISYGNFYW
jgi:hypothetical protein